MNKKIKFYTVDTEYMLYLKKYDVKIMENLGDKSKRPYIGILFEIDNNKYLAPLTSPKPKHLKMKNTLDFVKIDEGKLGAINLNNMFPVIDQVATLKNINLEKDPNYKELLTNQIDWVNKEENFINILKKAERLYNEITTNKEKSRLWERCCDFKLLEEKSLEYTKMLEIKQQQQQNQVAFDPLTGNKLIVEKGYKIPEKEVNQWITKDSVEKNNIETSFEEKLNNNLKGLSLEK